MHFIFYIFYIHTFLFPILNWKKSVSFFQLRFGFRFWRSFEVFCASFQIWNVLHFIKGLESRVSMQMKGFSRFQLSTFFYAQKEMSYEVFWKYSIIFSIFTWSLISVTHFMNFFLVWIVKCKVGCLDWAIQSSF